MIHKVQLAFSADTKDLATLDEFEDAIAHMLRRLDRSVHWEPIVPSTTEEE